MKKKQEVIDNVILDEYEQKIEDSIPQNFKPIRLAKSQSEHFIEVAKRHKLFKASKRINIRIKNEDLISVKTKAKNSNMPYQTLLSTLIHKYAKDDISINL